MGVLKFKHIILLDFSLKTPQNVMIDTYIILSKDCSMSGLIEHESQ